jgi:hypothetical protein
LYPSINTGGNILYVYTDGFIMGKLKIKKTKKYNNVSFIQTELPTGLTRQ